MEAGSENVEFGDDKRESFWIGLRVLRSFSIALNFSPIYFYFLVGIQLIDLKPEVNGAFSFKKRGKIVELKII
jgi:hypothetical protein